MQGFLGRLQQLLGFTFVALILVSLGQCARRGNPTGGPEDMDPPVLIKAEPPNMSINFKGPKIRLFFDEYIKLQDINNQLIVSPPLKNIPEITPQGGVSKFVEVILKDTLKENTTYTLNFGQSIVDNNEGNPNSFFTYTFSTGDYIDSLSITGLVKDAFSRNPDEFVSVMLYEIDTAYTDSTIFKSPPNYITNTQDNNNLFKLNNLKEGKYFLFGLKDEGKNNLFDQRIDKIGFLKDTINIPTDSLFLLNLFKEIPDYSISIPSYVAKNRILFGYQGVRKDFEINTLLPLPDSVKTRFLKERETDSLNFWFTPTDVDSLTFTVTNSKLNIIDTFIVKKRNVELDSLELTANARGTVNFKDSINIKVNTPITAIKPEQFELIRDSLPIPFTVALDTLDNKLNLDFELLPEQKYKLTLLPEAIEDFFGMKNDTLFYNFTTASPADYGTLRVTLSGAVQYPVIVQLADENGVTQKEIAADQPRTIEFTNLQPQTFSLSVVFDENGNGKWDTGNYLLKKQPERIAYFPDQIELRANWEEVVNFTIIN